MKIEELFLEINNAVCSNFNTLSKFDFKGVYIICDNGEVVYVGSAYARTIEQRLKQYISKSDTGNTLGKTVAKKLSGSQKYDKQAKSKMSDAIKKIKTFTIYAIQHDDLEYRLILRDQSIITAGKERINDGR